MPTTSEGSRSSSSGFPGHTPHVGPPEDVECIVVPAGEWLTHSSGPASESDSPPPATTGDGWEIIEAEAEPAVEDEIIFL